MHVHSSVSRAALAALLALAPACKSVNNPWETAGDPRTEKEVERVLEQAESLFAAGRTERALEKLRKTRRARGLSPELRNRIGSLTERSAGKRVLELSEPDSDPRDMAELFDLDLPRQIKVTAGIQAARMYLDDKQLQAAFRMIKKVDKAYPPAGTHHERVAAGEVLALSGLELIASKKSFFGFFSAAGKGEAMLEYMVLNYPLQRRCDEAFFALARRYEKQERWQIALERHEELIVNDLQSPLAVKSQARIPHLRLAALHSPEYDRRAMLLARFELETWLVDHGGGEQSELEQRVRLDYADCLGRLVENDLSVARFYRRIDKEFGARLHAERALETAQAAADGRVIKKVRKMLDSLGQGPAAEAIGTESAAPADGDA